MMKRWLAYLLPVLLTICALATTPTQNDYPTSIRAWQAHREQGLREPDGWLTLVGLFWLKPGQNTIGSASDNQMVLPTNSAPAHAGVIVLSADGKTVLFRRPDGTTHTVHYVPEREEDNTQDKPDRVTLGSGSFTVIERGGKLAVRARDSKSPVLQNFSGLRFFPVSPAWHIRAKFVSDEQTIPILNVLGKTGLQKSPGYVEFEYGGHVNRLRPIFEGKTLFFLFKDATNKVSTYQAGRMLNTPLPKDGSVDLDFNKAYNPPCTFTPFATCPLPPKENRLPFAVEAGEKRYGSGHPDANTN